MVQYDAIRDVVTAAWGAPPVTNDGSGHGTHVASLIANSDKDASGKFMGIAPNVQLISVKAFDANGAGRYADVIRAVGWVIAKRTAYDIRVLNCSFTAPARTRYWDDPLNQAIMRAWQAGITVVVSAGNRGPDPMTVGVPGNVPYVVTVGAMTDNYTQTNRRDDLLASFSSAGPTATGSSSPRSWRRAAMPGRDVELGADRDSASRVPRQLRLLLLDVRDVAGRRRRHRCRRR